MVFTGWNVFLTCFFVSRIVNERGTMRILITNDDGIQSPGLEALVRALHEKHQVIVAAPAAQQSAKAHAITVRERLYVDEYPPLQEAYGIKALAISGTPADTVKLYMEGIIQRDPAVKPELVVSGINDGSNVGTDILYSGTIGAATEGYVQGISALAVSLDYNAEYGFDVVAREVAARLELLFPAGCEKKLLNVNFPKRLSSQPKWLWCRQGVRDYANAYQPHHDEAGRLYYVVGGGPLDGGNQEDTDVMVSAGGNIAITPLQLERTNYEKLCLGTELTM